MTSSIRYHHSHLSKGNDKSDGIMLFKWRTLADASSALVIVSIVVIIAAAFGSYFYLQSLTEANVRDALFEKQKQSQMDNTKSLANFISSDLDSIAVRLEHFATSEKIQAAGISSQEAAGLLRGLQDEIGAITPVDTINILDNRGILVNAGSDNYRKYLGTDLSARDYVKGTRSNMDTYVSTGFEGLDGKYHLAIATPITDRNGQYLGLVVVMFPSLDFFEKHGNVNNLDTQLLVAVDRNGSYLSLVPQYSHLLGVSFFSEEVQKTNNGNPDIYRLYYESVKLGKFSYGTFNTGMGERFAVMSPVYFNGDQVMTVVYTTPTSLIYSQVDSVLANQRLQTAILLVAVMAAICLLIFYLARWNKTLQRTVDSRTEELAKSNKELTTKTAELEDANEQLTQHDKLQKEFINVAAHELRTPIQPILGATELLEQQLLEEKLDEVKITKAEVDLLVRNAKRLERLSSDILQVTRIESNKLVIEKVRMNLNDKIRNVIGDIESVIIASTPHDQRVKIVFEPKTEPIELEIDRTKIYEVISNLLRNALKFTKEGTITITSETLIPHDENTKDAFALVKVKDTGTGIDHEIFPKLFNKFATKSEQGTGLGLFISKSIIEAHGGRIWAENNSDGRGATFAFTLPMLEKKSVSV